MKADVKKEDKGFGFETNMKVTLFVIAGSLTLFLVALFVGYFINLPMR